MAVCCIGGVCVPVTAVLPLLALCVKWILTKLAKAGILPQVLCKKLGIDVDSKCDGMKQGNGSCCASTLHKKTDGDTLLIEIDSEGKWDEIVQKSYNQPILIKFSADWCRPCKDIHSFFLTLAGIMQLVEIDVDEDCCQKIVEEFKVTMMPTFIVLKSGKEAGRQSGSDERKLEEFARVHKDG